MEKITIDLQAKTDKAVQEIADLKKEIEKLNKAVESGNKDTKSGLDSITKSSNIASKGIKKIGVSLQAGVLGIFVLAFKEIRRLFENNQVVLDTFKTGFEALSLAFNDFFNFISSNAGAVIDSFKAFFEDPLQNIKDFGNAIKEGIINRFIQFKETLGFVAKGIGDLFKGN